LNKEFVYTKKFDREWNAVGLNDEDLRQLETFLLDNSEIGDIIVGTSGLRKLRWRLPHQGKSGSVRVLYLSYTFSEKLCMIDLFSKGEKVNLTDAEKNSIKQVVKQISEEFGK
jgi:hypothetical protein